MRLKTVFNQAVYHEVYGSGMPLVLVHGWGWHGQIWQPIVAELAKYFQVILVDLPGYGQSQLCPTEYTLENIARQIIATFPMTAHWLGWSMGGLVTSWIAMHYPHLVRKHILVASTPRFIQAQNWPGMNPIIMERFLQNLKENNQQTLNDFLLLQVKGSPKNRELIRQLRPQIHQFAPNQTALHDGLVLLKDTDLRDKFSMMNSSCLSIFGDQDSIIPVAVLEAIRLLSPHSFFSIIQEASHLPFLSHSEEFLAIVIDFLQRD